MVQKRGRKRQVQPGERALSIYKQEPEVLPPKNSRYDDLVAGRIQVSDMDRDELRRAKLRNNDGTFSRGPARILPESVRNQITRELHRRLYDEINLHAFDAVDTIVDVMNQGEGASAFQGQKDGTKRLDAAKYLLERVIGKIPDKSEITQTVTVWEGLNETGGLFVDIDAEEIPNDPPRELETGTQPEVVRKRGPRTRPNRSIVEHMDGPEPGVR
jgi:hypothetical protein